MARVACTDLWVRFGAFAALRGINLSIPPGEYGILVGPNGAGKSTLLRTLGGWTRPSDGTVTVDGLPFERHERVLRARVKLVPDTPTFYPELTAWEHIQVAARAHRLSRWQDSAEEWLAVFGLENHRGAYPGSFSRGMQYKLALIMSVLTAPAALLLDEPFGPLDPNSQLVLAERLRAMTRDGASVLASTHVLPPQHPPDRVLVLADGELGRDAGLRDVWTEGRDDLASLPGRLLAGADR